MPGATFGLPQPFMFGTGDYPVITGSGVDPAVLKWVPWYLRHSAAVSPSATHVLQIIEPGLGGDIDPEQLQTGDGRDQLGAYFGRGECAIGPEPGTEMTDEEMDRIFTPPSSSAHPMTGSEPRPRVCLIDVSVRPGIRR